MNIASKKVDCLMHVVHMVIMLKHEEFASQLWREIAVLNQLCILKENEHGDSTCTVVTPLILFFWLRLIGALQIGFVFVFGYVRDICPNPTNPSGFPPLKS